MEKQQKMSKYYVNDCLESFILIFMSLLTAPILKNSQVICEMWNVKMLGIFKAVQQLQATAGIAMKSSPNICLLSAI